MSEENNSIIMEEKNNTETNKDKKPEKNSSKRNKLIALFSAGVVAGCAIYGIQYSSSHSIPAVDRTIEYGTSTSLLYDAKDWVKDGTDYANITVGIQQKDKMKREYLEVGSYNVELTDSSSNKTGKCKLTVQDTTKPEWVKTTDEIIVKIGDKVVLKDYFDASDLSKVKYQMKNKVDTSKAGETKTTIVAKDSSGNKVTHDCTIKVVENEEEIKEENSSENANSENTSSSEQSNSGSTGQATANNQQATLQTQQSAPVQNSQSSSTQAQQNTQQSTTSTPSQSETTTTPSAPVCESIPAGAYSDYATANSVARSTLDSVSDANGWANSYYKINIGQTSCGTVYYMIEYGPC